MWEAKAKDLSSESWESVCWAAALALFWIIYHGCTRYEEWWIAMKLTHQTFTNNFL